MVDPDPVTSVRPVQVTLHGGDLPWQPVSPNLTRVRLITLALFAVPAIIATVVVGVLVTRWALLGTAAVVLVALWVAWNWPIYRDALAATRFARR